MGLFINILGIVIIGILAVSAIYTLVVGRQQKVVEGNMDTQIEKHVQKNAYIKNPIFLAYGIFFVLLLFIIFFVAITYL
ncbi:MAG: hypothetical protein ABGX20_07620 [Bacillus sp. (in: firmicutes)]|jgi:cytochrome bd-type quinol oxidase subunit 1|uniref:hypothetical protein n=1 Tax=Bacillus sp. SORGH_AS_0510 TaxID=3041771 RepID=UPI002786E552|nr:hypothetical protein [Bacillus sp. SORGH_AS_0510]MDQ1146887.1 cytochrome bd-type quinol oxidase subunit 1 [Bacillus sp. SORGH_AS_0510]